MRIVTFILKESTSLDLANHTVLFIDNLLKRQQSPLHTKNTQLLVTPIILSPHDASRKTLEWSGMYTSNGKRSFLMIQRL